MVKKTLEENFEMDNNEIVIRWGEVRKEVHTRIMKKYEEVRGDLKKNSLER